MDYERLSSELLRALRGRRSQPALAKRLGYRANVAYTWECGRRFPTARVLFRLAALNRLPLEPIVRFCTPPAPLELTRTTWSSKSSAVYLRALVGETPLVEIARATGVDRTTVARWLRGTTEPRVPELLRIIGEMTHRLVEFVTSFVEPGTLDTLRELAHELEAQRRTAYEFPWSHAVLRALELDAYRRTPRHVPGSVARAIGIDLAEEDRLLNELHGARLIRRQRGKWVVARVMTVDTRANAARDQHLKEHWAQVGLSRLRARSTPREAFHSYNLFAISQRDFTRIRELHVEYFERVRRIVAESNAADRVVLLMQQLVPLDEASAQ
jgi:transcriptional regulator with XRE-family HTH domain